MKKRLTELHNALELLMGHFAEELAKPIPDPRIIGAVSSNLRQLAVALGECAAQLNSDILDHLMRDKLPDFDILAFLTEFTKGTDATD